MFIVLFKYHFVEVFLNFILKKKNLKIHSEIQFSLMIDFLKLIDFLKFLRKITQLRKSIMNSFFKE